MIDAIYLFWALFGIVLIVRGIYLIYLSQNSISQLFGICFTRDVLIINFYFLGLLFSLFALLTTFNYLNGLVLNLSFNPNSSVFLNVPALLSAATLEEILFRALLFTSLINYSNNKPLLILYSSLFFSIFHFPSEGLHFLSYLLGGIMYGYAFVKFKSLLVPIGIHFFWNYVQGALFGYPVSGYESQGLLSITLNSNVYFNGGSQGPEGSLAGIVMRLIIILMIYILPSRELHEKFLKLPKELLILICMQHLKLFSLIS